MLDHREIFEWLLDQGLDINNLGGVGWPNESGSVLNGAAEQGDIEKFDYLVSRGAKPKLSIALHFAIKCTDPGKCVAMIKHLVEVYNFDVNMSDSNVGLWKLGRKLEEGNPICWALLSNNMVAVEELLRLGVDATRILVITVNDDMLLAAKLCLEHGAVIRDAEDMGIIPRSVAMKDLLGQWKYGKYGYSVRRLASDVFGRQRKMRLAISREIQDDKIVCGAR